MASKKLRDFVSMVKQGDYVILDTETTGLHNAVVIQIAVINSAEDVLVDSLVKPQIRIESEAMGIHGIDEETVKDAPLWRDVWSDVYTAIAGRNVIAYDADFDMNMLYNTAEQEGMGRIDWGAVAGWNCAMKAFAEVYGDWHHYHKSYRWKSLLVAVEHFDGVAEKTHSALADCLHTLFVVQEMAEIDLS